LVVTDAPRCQMLPQLRLFTNECHMKQSDLFTGVIDPMTTPRGRGRPLHQKSEQIAERVEALRGAGYGERAIAINVGLAPGTLRKYYTRRRRRPAA